MNPFRLKKYYHLSLLLLMVSVSLMLVQCRFLLPAAPVPTRSMIKNELPLRWQWTLTGRLASSNTAMSCHQDQGVMAGVIDGAERYVGTILFNHEGDILWHQDNRPSAVTLDSQGVYVFSGDRPVILAYDIETGAEIWRNEQAVFHRSGIPSLSITQEGHLRYLSQEQVNEYLTDDGTLIGMVHNHPEITLQIWG